MKTQKPWLYNETLRSIIETYILLPEVKRELALKLDAKLKKFQFNEPLSAPIEELVKKRLNEIKESEYYKKCPERKLFAFAEVFNAARDYWGGLKFFQTFHPDQAGISFRAGVLAEKGGDYYLEWYNITDQKEFLREATLLYETSAKFFVYGKNYANAIGIYGKLISLTGNKEYSSFGAKLLDKEGTFKQEVGPFIFYDHFPAILIIAKHSGRIEEFSDLIREGIFHLFRGKASQLLKDPLSFSDIQTIQEYSQFLEELFPTLKFEDTHLFKELNANLKRNSAYSFGSAYQLAKLTGKEKYFELAEKIGKTLNCAECSINEKCLINLRLAELTEQEEYFLNFEQEFLKLILKAPYYIETVLETIANSSEWVKNKVKPFLPDVLSFFEKASYLEREAVDWEGIGSSILRINKDVEELKRADVYCFLESVLTY